jgi:hypothetical protein
MGTLGRLSIWLYEKKEEEKSAMVTMGVLGLLEIGHPMTCFRFFAHDSSTGQASRLRMGVTAGAPVLKDKRMEVWNVSSPTHEEKHHRCLYTVLDE